MSAHKWPEMPFTGELDGGSFVDRFQYVPVEVLEKRGSRVRVRMLVHRGPGWEPGTEHWVAWQRLRRRAE